VEGDTRHLKVLVPSSGATRLQINEKGGEMLRCPKCDEALEARLNPYQDKEADYVEVEMQCENEHCYFCRIKEDDLIEI